MVRNRDDLSSRIDKTTAVLHALPILYYLSDWLTSSSHELAVDLNIINNVGVTGKTANKTC